MKFDFYEYRVLLCLRRLNESLSQGYPDHISKLDAGMVRVIKVDHNGVPMSAMNAETCSKMLQMLEKQGLVEKKDFVIKDAYILTQKGLGLTEPSSTPEENKIN